MDAPDRNNGHRRMNERTDGNAVPGPHKLIASIPTPHRAVNFFFFGGGGRTHERVRYPPYCGDRGYNITAVTWPTTKNGGYGYTEWPKSVSHYQIIKIMY